jgi:hypothetical protein
MRREIEKRVDALEASMGGSRRSTIIWVPPGMSDSEALLSSVAGPVQVDGGITFLRWGQPTEVEQWQA